MVENNGYIFDVNTQEFNEKVINTSHKSVVMVDFWANWCGPCRILDPVLENVVKSFDGRVVVAKVNVDENQELAIKYGIRSIPALKIFKDGSLVKEFVGVLPEGDITTILQSIVGDKTREALFSAAQLIDEGRIREAESIYSSVLEKIPDHPGALVGMARLAIRNGKYERVREVLNSVDESDKEYEEAQMLLSSLHFQTICTDAGSLEILRKHCEQNPDDLNAVYALGCCYAVENMYPEAFETFLSVIKRDKNSSKRKAKDAIISLFSIVGQNNEVTREYRGRLAQEIF